MLAHMIYTNGLGSEKNFKFIYMKMAWEKTTLEGWSDIWRDEEVSLILENLTDNI